MKVKYEILYKSGHVDVIEQEATKDAFSSINQLITKGFLDDESGVLNFGNRVSEGNFVRLSAVDRVKVNIIEGTLESD